MAKVKINPCPGYLLVKPLSLEKTTASGIVLPDSHEEKPQEGKVVALGPTLINEYGNKTASPCQKGDTVVFKKWSGSEYKPEGEETEHLFVKFDEVLAIIK
ncbi:co-chaperone GroES [Candidatus Shapirobacteria bacterium]|nr:co-chaperone GroES [Candidatus Shapirobacteria bacterium]